jgi:hypothetical protein
MYVLNQFFFLLQATKKFGAEIGGVAGGYYA